MWTLINDTEIKSLVSAAGKSRRSRIYFTYFLRSCASRVFFLGKSSGIGWLSGIARETKGKKER